MSINIGTLCVRAVRSRTRLSTPAQLPLSDLRQCGTGTDGEAMNLQSNSSGASVIPTVRYSDVGTAIEWLQEAFGLEPHRIVRDCQGNVLYGELTFGHGMIMVAPVQDSPLGKLMVQPDQVGGVETQICYLPVSDTKTHYARAKAAGAEIVLDLGADQGGGGYSCRDPQGHVWNFGTYDPWA